VVLDDDTGGEEISVRAGIVVLLGGGSAYCSRAEYDRYPLSRQSQNLLTRQRWNGSCRNAGNHYSTKGTDGKLFEQYSLIGYAE
jgi:hypothetical protein